MSKTEKCNDFQFSSVQWLSRVWLFATPWTVTLRAPPWDSPGKNAGVGCRDLFQGIFLTQGSNPGPLWLLQCRHFLYHWATREAPCIQQRTIKKRLTSDFSTCVLNVGRKVKEEHHQSSKRKSDLCTWHYSRSLQVKITHEINNTEPWTLVKNCRSQNFT